MSPLFCRRRQSLPSPIRMDGPRLGPARIQIVHSPIEGRPWVLVAFEEGCHDWEASFVPTSILKET